MDLPVAAEPTVLLEREHEIERVGAALRGVGLRAGVTLMTEGAAGMGKSRLLQDARVRASGLGFRVLGARARSSSRGSRMG